MSDQHIIVTDKTTGTNIQLLLGAIAAVIVSILGLGFVPGFLVAALIDWVIPLKAGPLWGFTLLVSLVFLIVAWWCSQQSFKWGIIRYTLIAFVLLLTLIIVSLFMSGKVFYGYTLQKMVETSESSFVGIEQERGRLPLPAAAPTNDAKTDNTTTETPPVVAETPPINPCETLNDCRFVGLGGIYYVRLFHQKGNTYEFTGKIEARDVNGTVRKERDNLTIIKGNVDGEFTLLNSCQELTGHFTDSYGSSISFDYGRQ